MRWHKFSSIGEMAKQKILAPIGLLRNEEITSTTPVEVNVSGVNEEMFVVTTRGKGDPEYVMKEDGVQRVDNESGRVLVSFSEDLSLGIEGGAFWIGKGGPDGQKTLQSIYVDPEFRRGKLTSLILEELQVAGVSSVTGPFSEEGQKFVERHGLEEESGSSD